MTDSLPACLQVLKPTDDEAAWLAAAVQRSGNPHIDLLNLIDHLHADDVPRFRDLIKRQASTPARAAARSNDAAESYEKHRDRIAKRERKKSLSSRDIGPIPPVKNPDRKAACERNLKLYLETYHAEWFPLAWSDDHLRVIAKIETTVLLGLQQAIAMPRGSGKSTICVGALIWSANYGHHQFQLLIHANSDKASNALDQIRFVYETNEVLAADFPEICYPVQQLQRIANRAKGQMHNGHPTYLVWSGNQIVLPVIPGAKSSGAVLMSAGLQEAVRGAVICHPATGRMIRPTLALVDDPQTRESAMSPIQSEQRREIITSDLMGCAGPGKQLAVLMVCTVIAPGDLADTMLDPDQFPDWSPERCRLIAEMPEDLNAWDDYENIRRACAKRIKSEKITDLAIGYKELNDYYVANRAKLDQNGRASWEARKLPHEISALQHGMNLYLKNPTGFWSEYQNDPIKALEANGILLEPADIAGKFSGYDRLQIPAECQWITAHVDVHKAVLYFTVAAWSPSFTGYVIDYGTFPKQPPGYFRAQKPRNSLQAMFPELELKSAVLKGLSTLFRTLFTTAYRRQDGLKMHLDLCLGDRGWLPTVVDTAAETSEFADRILPTNGRKFGPDERPLSECKPKAGEFIGDEWTLPPPTNSTIRHCQFDTYHWKDFITERLATPIGQRGALSLFGKSIGQRATEDHDFYAEQQTAEMFVPRTGRRTVNVWQMKPGRSENHWFDTLVGCAVAASIKGASALGFHHIPVHTTKTKQRKVTYLERSQNRT